MLKFSNSNKGISTPILLSIVALSGVVLVGLIVFLQFPRTDETDEKTDLKSTEQTQTEVKTETKKLEEKEIITEAEIADRKTYKNENIGIEFQYQEKIFGNPFVAWEKDKSIGTIFSFSEEKYRGREYSGLSFNTYAFDYPIIPPGFGVFIGDEDITSYCREPLKMKKTSTGDWKMCKAIEIDGQKAIFETFASNYECCGSFDIFVYFNNQEISSYRGLVFSLYRLELENKMLRFMPSCTEGGDIEKFELDFYTQSMNIMENKNLSEIDKEKLNAFNQMLSSFRFLE
jgi:hypothetical protein